MAGTGKGMYTGSISSPSYAYTTGGSRIVDSSGGSPYGSISAGPGNSLNTKTHNVSLDPALGDYSMGEILSQIMASIQPGASNNLNTTNLSPVTNVNIPDASPIIKTLADSGKDIAGQIGNSLSSGLNSFGNTISEFGKSFASSMADLISTSNSDYADVMRELMDVSKANSALSQQNAREQMKYQKESDQAAMAWSAAEAEKNRKWQEKLSNSAHQREVKDLMKAGLNPILAANNGAYTGSGATGQGFSSSGAQGTVDTSGSAALSGLMSSIMNSASQAAITGMYTDAQKYQADMSYAAAKLASEASIYNNHNTNTANKAINQMNNEYELQRANINANATLASAGTYAAANRYAADASAAATQYMAKQNLAGTKYTANVNAATRRWEMQHNIHNDPVGYFTGVAQQIANVVGNPKAGSNNNGNANYEFKYGNGNYNNMMR